MWFSSWFEKKRYEIGYEKRFGDTLSTLIDITEEWYLWEINRDGSIDYVSLKAATNTSLVVPSCATFVLGGKGFCMSMLPGDIEFLRFYGKYIFRIDTASVMFKGDKYFLSLPNIENFKKLENNQVSFLLKTSRYKSPILSRDIHVQGGYFEFTGITCAFEKLKKAYKNKKNTIKFL